jgi:hypothetical protein
MQSWWQRFRRYLLPAVVGAIWLGSVGIGICALQRYSSAPAAEQVPPSVWPSASRLPRTVGKPTLVLVAHPRCPCTRATVHELGVLMARAGALVTADVVFVRPTGVASDWERTDLWRSANEIPGVTVTTDDSGREAALFHAATSGQVVLFDSAGREIFAGGITESRGHEGDNPGLARILSLLTHGSAERATAPVFGCALNDPKPLNERSAVVALSKNGANRSGEKP